MKNMYLHYLFRWHLGISKTQIKYWMVYHSGGIGRRIDMGTRWLYSLQLKN